MQRYRQSNGSTCVTGPTHDTGYRHLSLERSLLDLALARFVLGIAKLIIEPPEDRLTCIVNNIYWAM